MAFDGITTKSIVCELNNKLIGAKINKVYQPNKLEIMLSAYNNGKNYNLNININPDFCRIHLTKYSKPNPLAALNFCMLLRKYLVGSKILSISTFDLERTIEIKLECYNELNDLVIRKLYIEIMSRQSNIVLTNENNVIIDSLKHFEKSLPAHIFESVAITKNSFINLNNFEEFSNIIKASSSNNLEEILSNSFIGFSKSSINTYLNILNINKNNYDKNDLENLYNYLKELISNIENGKTALNFENKNYSIVSDINNNSFENSYINYSLDEFYFNLEQNDLFKSAKNNLLKIILANLKKTSKKLENINKKLSECENMEIYKIYGQLLTSNLYRFNSYENLEFIKLENYYDNNNLIKIPLDKTVNIHKNADKFFKKYNKLKNTLEIVNVQKQEALIEIDYIESIVFSLEKANNFDDLNDIYTEITENFQMKPNKNLNQNTKKKKIPSTAPALESITIDNYLIYYGKNNIQNNYLTLKFASKNDIWFHVQDLHGSHVVLKVNTPDEEIPENILFECAKLAKENSKASSSLNVPVDYCKIKFVKKIPGAKPVMVNYTNYKTIIIK